MLLSSLLHDHLSVKTTVRDGRFREVPSYEGLPVSFQTLMNVLWRVPATKRAVTQKEASHVPAAQVTHSNNGNASVSVAFDTLMPRQNGCRFADDIFKCIFLNENFWFLTQISLKYAPYGLIDNMAALIQIMAWRRRRDKPLSEPMMVSLLTHICVTLPQWANSLASGGCVSNSKRVISHLTNYVHGHVLWNCVQVNATEHIWW